ncbi:MAG: hypothetical protein DMG67_05190, partial [Acidobacteria bacterium]
MKAKVICVCLAVALCLTAAVAKSGDWKKDVDNLRSQYAELFNQKQADKLADLYAEDAVLITTGTETIQGRKNIHDYLQQGFAHAVFGRPCLRMGKIHGLYYQQWTLPRRLEESRRQVEIGCRVHLCGRTSSKQVGRRYINSSINALAAAGGTRGSRCTSGPSFVTGS